MAYEYDKENGGQPPQPPKKASDIGSWLFLAVMVAVGIVIGAFVTLVIFFGYGFCVG